MKTPFSVTYNAAEYYGEVKCTGKHVVSKKYPEGADVEKCEAVSGTLLHMKVGKGQKLFENSGGGTVGEWESDDPGDGQRTTNFSYNVPKSLKSFKLVAIY